MTCIEVALNILTLLGTVKDTISQRLLRTNKHIWSRSIYDMLVWYTWKRMI